MGVYFIIAYRNLVQAPRRTLLLSAALGIVTMLLVLLTSLSAGLEDTMIKAATTLSAGHVNVSGFFKVTSNDPAPIITERKKIRQLVIDNTEGLDYVIDRHRGWGRIVSETSSLNAGIVGIDVAEEGRFLSTIRLAKESDYKEGGRDEVLGDPQRLKEKGQILVFVEQARRLGVTVGDLLTITTETFSGFRNTTEVTVAAIAKDVGIMSNWSVFVSKSTILELYQWNDDTAGAVFVYLKDPDKAGDTMEHLRKVIEKAGYQILEHNPQPFFMKFEDVAGEDWSGQRMDLTIWKDEVSFLTWVLTAIDSVSYFLLTILVVIIVIGIMNTMSIAVRERTKEIGTLRAFGMQRPRVLMMFIIEAMFLGLFATTVGAIIGGLIAWGVNAAHISVPVEAVRALLMSDTIHLVVRPSQILSAVAVFTLVTIVSALWPAIRAARLEPVTAIHTVA